MATVERDGQQIEVEGTWRLPDHRIMPEVLTEALRTISRQLEPAGDEGVRKVMMPLMLTQIMPAVEGVAEGNMQALFAATASEYTRHLRDVPLDLLETAATALARESPHFPRVADFFRHAQPVIDRRRRQSARINAIAEAQKRAAEGKPAFVPEADDVKWRGDVERFHKFAGGSMHDMLRRRAIDSERKLAELEGREPDLEQFGPDPVKVMPPPITKRSPITGRTSAVTDVDEQPSPADAERQRREAHIEANAAPAPDDLPHATLEVEP